VLDPGVNEFRQDVLSPTPVRASTPKCVLYLFTGLLQVGLCLVDGAFGLKIPVAGDLTSIALDSAAQLLNLVAEFVRETHVGRTPF
jgi:hypothetical protein